MTGSKLPTMIVAGLLVATVVVPATAVAEPSEPDDDFYECMKNGWGLHYCLNEELEDPDGAEATAASGDTIDCLYEHLKNGWFVGNCLH